MVRNKPGFHSLMLRNGWHVPSIHSEICSLKWMKAVRKLKIYCPRRSDRNNEKHCWSPPPLKVLLHKLETALKVSLATARPDAAKAKQISRFIRSFNKHPPNREWTVEVLAIWAPKDPIFERSYKYVKPKTDYDLFLDNEDGFFDDLPKLNEKYIRKTNRLRMPKKVR